MNYKFNKVQSYKKKLISKHLLFIFFIMLISLIFICKNKHIFLIILSLIIGIFYTFSVEFIISTLSGFFLTIFRKASKSSGTSYASSSRCKSNWYLLKTVLRLLVRRSSITCFCCVFLPLFNKWRTILFIISHTFFLKFTTTVNRTKQGHFICVFNVAAYG